MPILSSLKKSIPSWDQTKSTSKQGFDKAWAGLDKLGAPVNKLSNKLGSEAFWPTALDKESEKAARILKSFVKDGFYTEEDRGKQSPRSPGVPSGKQRVVKKIPTEVIRQAKGLAIFTTCRTGLWFSGAGGSGVLVARMPNGEWSPPSGIMLHTAALGFLIGIDIYDCVVVINTEEALQAFSKIRCTVGGEVSAVAGPVGVGGILDSELHKRQAPIWTYLKSRGFYAGVQVDGTIIIERTDENEKFYGERIGVADILAGKARHPPREADILINTIKMAQGDRVDARYLPDSRPTPGDLGAKEIEESDPDPLGILALEQAGIEIKEIGADDLPKGATTKPVPPPLPSRTKSTTIPIDQQSTSTQSRTSDEYPHHLSPIISRDEHEDARSPDSSSPSKNDSTSTIGYLPEKEALSQTSSSAPDDDGEMTPKASQSLQGHKDVLPDDPPREIRENQPSELGAEGGHLPPPPYAELEAAGVNKVEEEKT